MNIPKPEYTAEFKELSLYHAASATRFANWWVNLVGIKTKRHVSGVFAMYLAEKGGFEPPLGYYPKHAFQACDLNRSSTSPKGAQNIP